MDPGSKTDLRLAIPADWQDTDPFPRASTVGAGSAYASVATARAVRASALTVTTGAVELPDRTLVNLPDWSFSTGDSAEREVKVPHTWSRREDGLADFRGPARYRRRVHSTASHARLLCHSLDYVAHIAVDGAPAVAHEGGFTPVAVELPTGRPVTVELMIDDPVEDGLLDEQGEPLIRPKRKIKGVHEWHDSRPGGLAVGDGFHRTWIRRWGTGGITRPVVVHETGGVRIDATFTTATPGELRLSWVLVNLSGAPVDAEILTTIAEQTVRATAHLQPGANRVSVRLECSGERLWHMDDPHLYRLATAVVVQGAVSDADRVDVGFRTVTMCLDESAPFQLAINGRRTYVRAANYIPSAWPAEVSTDMLSRDVALARAANLNSFGVHAGVWPELLPICDTQGLLIYQDFPLQWSYDPGAGPLFEGGLGFTDASHALAAELVYLLYNHPSVVYWCGHNEPAYQLYEAFAAQDVPELAAFAAQLQQLPNERDLDQRRAELFQQIDPTRPAFPASGLGASQPVGDVHNYSGSLGGGSATDVPADESPFLSEYGAWCANFSAAHFEHDWHEQTHLLNVQESFAGRAARYEDFATWCFAGQLWAGWHAKLVTEKARLAKYEPSAGQRYHFFVDHYGHAGAGVVDRHRTTGPAYRGLAAANRALLAMAPFPAHGRVSPGATVSLPITVVNDTSVDYGNLALRWRLAALDADDAFVVGRDEPAARAALGGGGALPDQVAVLPRAAGRTLLEGETSVTAPADSSSVVANVRWVADHAGPVALFLDLDGIVGWTSFVVQPAGWSPQPGLTGPRRFTVTADRPATLRRRWTGEDVDPANAPPDQYLFGDIPIDVYDNVHVHADGSITTSSLPWLDPLAAHQAR